MIAFLFVLFVLKPHSDKKKNMPRFAQMFLSKMFNLEIEKKKDIFVFGFLTVDVPFKMQ